MRKRICSFAGSSECSISARIDRLSVELDRLASGFLPSLTRWPAVSGAREVSNRTVRAPSEGGAVCDAVSKASPPIRNVASSCWIGIVWFFLFLLAPVAKSGDAAPEQPDILIIIANSLGWKSGVGQLSPEHRTPSLEKLASEGMYFERCYSSPFVPSAMAGLLTGRDAYQSRITAENGDRSRLPAYALTLGELLSDHGYDTAWFGRWPLGANPPHHPVSQGFAEFGGWFGSRLETGMGQSLAAGKGTSLASGDFPEDAVTGLALDYMERPRKGPFCCVVSFGSPQISEKESPAALADYAVQLERLDAAVGRLLERVDKTGRTPGTLVWFTATGGRAEDGLYGGPGSLHEGGTRVPCVVRWPGQFPAGSVMRRIVTHLDLFPTLAEVARIPLPAPRLFEGMSLLAALRAGGPVGSWPNRLLFCARPCPPYEMVESAAAAVRTDRWLAVRDPAARRGAPTGGEAWELYDILTDPAQRYDVGKDYGYVLGHMRADYAHWFSENTTNGFATNPTELGHQEWPVIRLMEADATRTVENGCEWSLKVGAAGTWRVWIDGIAPSDQSTSSWNVRIGEWSATASPDLQGRLGMGTVKLPEGDCLLLLTPGLPSQHFEAIRLEAVTPDE